jgi:hypothetical protein
MSYRFAVGEAVEYKPVGAKVGLFMVVRQMPEEHQAVDRKYRIKSEHEEFERNVLECDLSPLSRAKDEYAPQEPLRRAGGH